MDGTDCIFLDFETRSLADLTKTSYHNYFSHPATSVLFMSYSPGTPTKEQDVQIWIPGKPWPKELQRKPKAIVVHNWNFEYNAFLYLPELQKAPDFFRDLSLYDCTMNFAYRWGLPGAMTDCARFLGFKEGKIGEGKQLIQKYSLPQKPKRKRGEPEPPESEWFFNDLFAEENTEDREKFFRYGRQDVVVSAKIYSVLPEIGEFERKVYELDKKINTRGICFDLKSTRKIKAKYDEDFQKAELAAEALAGRENGKTLTIKSPKFAAWLAARGFPVPNCQKDTLEEIAEDPKCPKVVKDAIALRFMLSGAAIKKLDKILEYSDEQGRAKHLMQYYGAHTGRWAGRDIQPHNFPRECISESDFDSVLATYLSDGYAIEEVPAILKQLLRPLIIPAPGNVLYGSDLSAIEARTAFWLAECQSGIDGFGNGRDIYVEFASRIPFDASKKGKDLNAKQRRQVGKTAVLSLQYGAGAETFNGALKSATGIEDPGLSAKVVEIYRKTYFEIPRYWKELEAGFIQAMKSGRGRARKIEFVKTKTSVRAVLPSGREMNFFQPRLQGNSISLLHSKYGYRKTWGGSLLENVASAVARDVIAEKMLAVESQVAPVVLSVHDEIEAEGKKSKARLQTFEKIMAAPVSWAPGLPLKAEGGMMRRYGK